MCRGEGRGESGEGRVVREEGERRAWRVCGHTLCISFGVSGPQHSSETSSLLSCPFFGESGALSEGPGKTW